MATAYIPHAGPGFEALMAEIDATLAAAGKEIPSRPLLAVREVSLRYEISIPLSGDSAGLPEDLKKHAPLSEAIRKWYDDHYGERLKEDPCPGRSVLVIDDDLYVIRIPRIFGGAQFVISRHYLPPPGIGRKLANCNVVQLVEGMTPAKALRLSNDALTEIAQAFERALPASYILESTQHELMYFARGDVVTAVNNLMDRSGRFGESKWASLQAAEKTLKAAIVLEGARFRHTHNLALLFQKLEELGIAIAYDEFVTAIQCDPKIRYGAESCTRAQALKAHQSSLDLVNALASAGAKFASGLGGRKS